MVKKLAAPLLALYLVLGVWKGYLAIFEQDAPEPRQIFAIPVDALPPSDQEALNEGIIVRNDTRLQQLLEDYLS